MDEYIRKLEATTEIRKELLNDVILYINLPEGSSGLDVGCGIGHITRMLAESLGSMGCITGIDASPAMIEFAVKYPGNSVFTDRMNFKVGSSNSLPFGDNSFDWAWSSDAVAYYREAEQFDSIKEMKRVVKPGGRVFLFIYSGQQLLPGYPVLEAKLNSTSTGIAPFRNGDDPETHYLRTLGLLRETGLVNTAVKAFTCSFHAPLDPQIHEGLHELILMRWNEQDAGLGDEDRAEYRRITDPSLPGFILNIPDYYGFFTYSLFQGTVI